MSMEQGRKYEQERQRREELEIERNRPRPASIAQWTVEQWAEFEQRFAPPSWRITRVRK